jgi:hypothetical protein
MAFWTESVKGFYELARCTNINNVINNINIVSRYSVLKNWIPRPAFISRKGDSAWLSLIQPPFRH